MTHGSLFSGIGGFDLAAEWAGWENAFHCEWNEFGRKILKYYWHDTESYGDITKTDFTIWSGRIDVLTGGFPCQPYSLAGKRLGKEDERHLWPDMLRAIREISPRWVVGENVSGLRSWNGGLVFDEVQADLEAEGYEVTPFLLPACGVNAPHKRERIWFVAYTESVGLQLSGNTRTGRTGFEDDNSQVTTNPNCQRQPGKELGETEPGWITKESVPSYWQNFPTQSQVCGRNDGFSSGLAGITFSKHRNESIKAYGNAIVPQVAYQIFQSINLFETHK